MYLVFLINCSFSTYIISAKVIKKIIINIIIVK